MCITTLFFGQSTDSTHPCWSQYFTPVASTVLLVGVREMKLVNGFPWHRNDRLVLPCETTIQYCHKNASPAFSAGMRGSTNHFDKIPYHSTTMTSQKYCPTFQNPTKSA